MIPCKVKFINVIKILLIHVVSISDPTATHGVYYGKMFLGIFIDFSISSHVSEIVQKIFKGNYYQFSKDFGSE